MKDRRPGTYYFPNEGLRYWDGEEWSESEPRPDNPEGSNAQHAAAESGSRPAGRKGNLPWVIAGTAVIAAGAVAVLLMIGGGADGDPVSASPTAVGDTRASDPSVSAALDMSVRSDLKPRDIPQTDGEVCALTVYVGQEFQEEISGAVSGGGYAMGDMTGLIFAQILTGIAANEAPGELGERGRQLSDRSLRDYLTQGFLSDIDAKPLSEGIEGIKTRCRELGGIVVPK